MGCPACALAAGRTVLLVAVVSAPRKRRLDGAGQEGRFGALGHRGQQQFGNHALICAVLAHLGTVVNLLEQYYHPSNSGR